MKSKQHDPIPSPKADSVESGVEELMHIHPPPPHQPTEGADVHPTLEPLEGPTEASNRDRLPPVHAAEE